MCRRSYRDASTPAARAAGLKTARASCGGRAGRLWGRGTPARRAPRHGPQRLEVHRQGADHLHGPDPPVLVAGATRRASRCARHDRAPDVAPTERQGLLGSQAGVGEDRHEHRVPGLRQLRPDPLDLERRDARGRGHLDPRRRFPGGVGRDLRALRRPRGPSRGCRGPRSPARPAAGPRIAPCQSCTRSSPRSRRATSPIHGTIHLSITAPRTMRVDAHVPGRGDGQVDRPVDRRRALRDLGEDRVQDWHGAIRGPAARPGRRTWPSASSPRLSRPPAGPAGSRPTPARGSGACRSRWPVRGLPRRSRSSGSGRSCRSPGTRCSCLSSPTPA